MTFSRFVDAVEWLVAALAALTVVLLFVAQPTVASGAAADPEEGAGIFAANCSGCHGADGSGGVGPALVGAGALAGFEDSESVARFVSVGVPGRMPGFETRLSPDEINAVAEFVYSGLGS
jgi:mono/diheme cytochrome c family protein